MPANNPEGSAFVMSVPAIHITHASGVTCSYCQPLSMSTPLRLGQAWNGPICSRCGRGYLGVHDCDLVPIPCPDRREGCLVAHYGHKAR